MTRVTALWARAGLVALVFSGVLAACAGARPGDLDTPVAAGHTRFVSDDYGIVVVYPDRVHAANAFQPDYFLGSRWNSTADDDTAGSPLLALTLPGSNKLTRGVMRVGASDDARAVDACERSADGTRVTTQRIGGVRFTRVDSADAAMNHYSRMQRYRAVHDGRCVAIDLIVTGVNADVYAAEDRPRQPFTPDQAMNRLHALLDGVFFTR
ncbi:hypothetical protein [Salinisphaera sp. T31B1]|uniref:hypothetical protein n=1 Tax=Salinisphaera sp. T31B1 TaxID=727963 RepID=UPI003340C655